MIIRSSGCYFVHLITEDRKGISYLFSDACWSATSFKTMEFMGKINKVRELRSTKIKLLAQGHTVGKRQGQDYH